MGTQTHEFDAKVIAVARILVIDDDDLFRSMLAEILEMEGFEVESAADGDVGVAKFLAHSPEVVVTDIVMPEKEGIQTIRELLQVNPEAKIIAMSGGGRRATSDDYLALAEDLGAQRTLSKPFQSAELIEAIRTLLTEAG